ncbi:uncharacterized protein METZ01_LOCUS304758 [marine metagenome]|uniref:5-formyltetrahydrofolate cyclo-ligase n=1 Tax=marine metagenome TaxID=408172 RepID=A0A382MSE4_9ZZZZ
MNNLRTRIKEKRDQLSNDNVVRLGKAIFRNILDANILKDKKRIAIYYSVNNEVATMQIIKHLWTKNKELFLPMINLNQLMFGPYKSGDNLSKNKFGIPEPTTRTEKLITADILDLVIVPLVAFDSDCNRLGMGGGFYDRALAFKKTSSETSSPLLIGLAYELQKVKTLEINSWDIPMDGIISESRTYLL